MRVPFPTGLLAGLALPLLAGAAQAVEYKRVDLAKSSLVFVSKQMGVAVDGRFRRFNASLSFDPAAPTKGRAEIAIELASVDTGVPEADEEVVGKDWFNVASFPKASFVSREVKVLGSGKYEALGELTIKGSTRPVKAPFTVREAGGRAVFDGNFTMLRGDFAVGAGAWADYGTVANEIVIRFHFEATP
jgi:polyisoprenoid-binding protein YceI